MEAFFRNIAILVNQSLNFQTILNNTSCTALTKKSVRSGLSAKMTCVNDALSDNSFRVAIWQHLNISSSVRLPELPGAVLYGDVSSSVHLPGIPVIYVSNENPVEAHFYTAISKTLIAVKKIVTFSEAEVAVFEEKSRFI